MKKLFSTILVLGLLLSGNAFAEILRLSCVAADKTMTTNVLIDMSEKKMGSVQGYPAKTQVSPDRFLLEYTFAGGINVIFSIDRNSGIFNEVWTNNKDSSAEYFNGKCSLAKKKF
jgi:hypothetical protein